MITQPTKSKSLFEYRDYSSWLKKADYFCCIHIFSAKLLICSQTFINLKHIWKLEIHKFDVRFHSKVGKSNLSCFIDCTKHASAGTLIHLQHSIYWIFTQQNWAASTDINFYFVAYWALIKHQALLTIRAKLKLAVFFFFTVRSR